MSDGQATQNTDVRLFADAAGNEVFATQGHAGLGINVGGLVFVKPLATWHALARMHAADFAAIPPVQAQGEATGAPPSIDLIGKVLKNDGNSSPCCPLCGWDYPHEHTAREITIYRNGVKWGQRNGAEPWPGQDYPRPSQNAEDDTSGAGSAFWPGADQRDEHRAGKTNSDRADHQRHSESTRLSGGGAIPESTTSALPPVAGAAGTVGEAKLPDRWLWRVFNLGWPRGHEDSTNEWGDWDEVCADEAIRLAGEDTNGVYEFTPLVPTDPRATLPPTPPAAGTVPLSVWFGPMPESNGKTNWTAILHRGDLVEGHTIGRSEHHDRVRYEADCVRYLIGELSERPDILAYDPDMLSPAGTVPIEAGGGVGAVLALPADARQLIEDVAVRRNVRLYAEDLSDRARALLDAADGVPPSDVRAHETRHIRAVPGGAAFLRVATPGVATVVPRYFLIHFDDADRRPEVFTDEAAARQRYAQVSTAWNARLFGLLDATGHDAGVKETP